MHNDFTPAFRSILRTRTPLIDLFVENGGRVCIFNTWRRFDPGIHTMPLHYWLFPLSYGGNPGVNGESHRGANGKRSG